MHKPIGVEANIVASANQRLIRASLEADGRMHGVKITCQKTGWITVRKTYFYRHGGTAQSFEARVLRVLHEVGIVPMETDHADCWRTWPKESFWEVRISHEHRMIAFDTPAG